MQKLAAVWLAVALALLVAAAADAKGAKKSSGEKLSGTVTMLDASARTLELKHGKKGNKTTSFQLAADTPISAGSQARAIGDLAVGQRVTVTYAMEGDARMAKRVEIEGAAKP